MKKTTLKDKFTLFNHQRPLVKDTCGQVSMDYIAGVVLFMITFIFLFQTLSNLFIPFQSNSDEIKSMSDRVAMVLVESTDGLASTPTETNIISVMKATVLHQLMNDSKNISSPSYDNVKEYFGLSSDTTNYNLNISLTGIDNSIYTINGNQVINNGPNIPENANVARTTRIVYIEQTNDIAKLLVTVW